MKMCVHPLLEFKKNHVMFWAISNPVRFLLNLLTLALNVGKCTVALTHSPKYSASTSAPSVGILGLRFLQELTPSMRALVALSQIVCGGARVSAHVYGKIQGHGSESEAFNALICCWSSSSGWVKRATARFGYVTNFRSDRW